MENVRLRTGRIKSKPEHSMQSCQEGVYSVLSCVWPFATPQTVIHRAPLSMKFSTQEYWSGLPFPSPGDLPDPGIKPTFLVSPALASDFFTTVPPRKLFTVSDIYFVHNSLYLLSSTPILLLPLPSPCPLYLWVLYCSIHWCFFLRFQIYVKSHSICLSLSGLFH